MSTETMDRLDPRSPALGLPETVDRVYAIEGRGFVIRDTRYRRASQWIAVASLGDLTHPDVHTDPERGHLRPTACHAYPVHVGTLRDAVRLMPTGECSA